ncbi:MAG: putative Na+/H+ antiporter [Alphaproteobacteria bacterium]
MDGPDAAAEAPPWRARRAPTRSSRGRSSAPPFSARSKPPAAHDVPAGVEIAAATLFAIAVIHTFSTKYFEHLAHTRPNHAGLWHLLGEVEGVFNTGRLIVAVAVTVGLRST